MTSHIILQDDDHLFVFSYCSRESSKWLLISGTFIFNSVSLCWVVINEIKFINCTLPQKITWLSIPNETYYNKKLEISIKKGFFNLNQRMSVKLNFHEMPKGHAPLCFWLTKCGTRFSFQFLFFFNKKKLSCNALREKSFFTKGEYFLSSLKFGTIRGQFHHNFIRSFYKHRSQKLKKDSQHKQLFALSGSAGVKAARKLVDEIDPRSL